jgi:HEAT repeat protein
MTQLFAGVATIVLAIILYGLGRKPSKPLLSSTDVSEVVALNRAQVELVQQEEVEETSEHAPVIAWQPPSTSAERLAMQQSLRRSMEAGPDLRLQAIKLAGQWGHPSVLPLLRRGLHDSDSQVVEAAAAAIERHRGGLKPAPAQPVRPPRNVARMR